MAIAHEFEYVRPKSLDDAVELLVKYGPKAQLLAGGTDLIGWIRDDLTQPEALIDIKGIDGLAEIEFREDTLFIGALVTFNMLIESGIIRKTFPLIMEMAKTVASNGLRNRATMVGNICSGVPCCDSGPVLLVYDAEVRVKGSKGERKIPLKEWFIGPKKTALKEDELVTGVAISLPKNKHAGCYVKLGRYKGEDLAQASVAILALAGNCYKIAFGAVAPVPVRAMNIEAMVNGKNPDDKLIEKAKELVPQEISPITDIRASEEYRTHMVKIMLERAIRATAERFSGKGPKYGTALI